MAMSFTGKVLQTGGKLVRSPEGGVVVGAATLLNGPAVVGVGSGGLATAVMLDAVVGVGKGLWWVFTATARRYRVLIADKDGRCREADLFTRRFGAFHSPHSVTTRKGRHFYLSLPTGIEAKTRLRFRGMMLDLLCGPGRYVVG